MLRHFFWKYTRIHKRSILILGYRSAPQVDHIKNWWSVPHSTYPYMQARSRNSLYFRGVALVDSHGLWVQQVPPNKKGVRSPKRVDLSTIYTLSWAYPFFRSLVGGLFGSPIINLPILTIINPCDTFLNKLGFVSEPLLSILPGSTLKWSKCNRLDIPI